ncbi:MAG: Arc family DNA-binding protein [Chloroflexota bacterium]|nr:MAG: Arc family DNA-binding protein [Chloroflexota bacterium]
MKRFSLRLPEDLHEALQRTAEKEYRSLHNQILAILESYVRQVEYQDLQQISGLREQSAPPIEGTQDRLMIRDGDLNQEIDLLELSAQAFAVFGTRNRHFLRVFNWDPESEDSRQEFRALAEAGYHIRRWR